MIALLMACNRDGIPDTQDTGDTDNTGTVSVGTAAETGTDTGSTEPCSDVEVIANGLDDDCDGWADEYGPSSHAVADGTVAFQGLAWDYLGKTLAVGTATDDTVWMVAGGGDDAGYYTSAQVHAAPQPGGPLMRIVADQPGLDNHLGRAVAVGAYDDGPMSVIASDSGYFAGLYRAAEGILDQSSDASSELDAGVAMRSGDLDGDGFDELTISLGGLTILRGPVGEPRWDNQQAKATFDVGMGIGEIADFNGDGVPEIPVWSGEETGQVRLIPGDITGDVVLTDVAQASLYGELPFDDAGRSAAAGDANGDGYVDLLAGAPLSLGRRGTAYLVYGPITGDGPLAGGAARVEGDFDVDWCGQSLAFLPDSDGDGADDPAVACAIDPYFTFLPGRIQLYRGLDAQGTLGLADAAAYYVGPHPGDLAGYQMHGKHDLTGDGVPDLAVGVPRDETFAAPAGGAVYVLPGPLL